MKTTAQAITPRQIKQIRRLGSDAIEKVLGELGLDNPGAQRVIEHGDEFAEVIRTAARASFKDLSIFNKFKNEEVPSNCGYLSGYKPKEITEQTNRLRELFPGIGNACEEIAEGELPEHAEGWFAIPKWQTVASTYGEALEKVLAMIKETHDSNFKNHLEGQLGLDRLRQSARTTSAWEKLSDEQKNHDILVVPAQFGIHHRGRSVRRAHEVFAQNEMGLGAFAIGIMLLTHPERLQHRDDLWIDCVGDEYRIGRNDEYPTTPLFCFRRGQIIFKSGGSVAITNKRRGSASAFVRQK